LLAASVTFNVPVQDAAQALLAFSQQAHVEVLYSHDDLRLVSSSAINGEFEPAEALSRLLKGTGFAARRNAQGKFIVTRLAPVIGRLEGRFAQPDGAPIAGLRVALPGIRQQTATDEQGGFVFDAVPPGRHRLVAAGAGYKRFEQADLAIEAGKTTALDVLRLETTSEVTVLEPYLVEGEMDRLPIGEGVGTAPRRAGGNLDLPRTEDNALPFTIYTREQIERSGVVQLNEFFQRSLLDGSVVRPPEQDGSGSSIATGSSNLPMRGYGSGETVVLVNGRRLPETFTETPNQMGTPDVNLVPLSLVQQVEVLPASASALFSGNAVGGVINIVLLPEIDGTEVRATYTNALGGFDAPQSSVSLLHGQRLLDGTLRLRFNATFTRTMPVLESELNYQRARLAGTTGVQPRATPNIESADPDSTGLFGPGTALMTSVAPGADGRGGLAAFAGRAGVLSQDLFARDGAIIASLNSRGYPYGRKQHRSSYYGSVVYDVRPWLQLGLDASYAQTVINRGLDLFPATLTLKSVSPLNPFGQDVSVTLNETAAALGQNYSEARVQSGVLVGGVLLKLPADWRVILDLQYARNTARYRGLVRVDSTRWQQLVDEGLYQPLRDTQVSGPPPAFYDRVLVYHGAPNRFVTLGDYFTIESTARLTNEALRLPTGQSTVNVGVDYRYRHLDGYTEEPRFADGTPAGDITRWSGRTLEQISVFGEVQAPLLSAARLPRWLKRFETDSSARYSASANSNETNLAPTLGLKADFTGGFSVRGSFTTSNRYPTPVMGRPLADGAGGGSSADLVRIFDPVRNERYEVESRVAINPGLRPEAAVTQTFGILYQHGTAPHLRLSLDFADTTKTNEFIALDAQAVLNLESLFPDRITRNTAAPGSPPRVTTVLTSPANVARRHSQNWNAAAEWSWRDFHGGRLTLSGRWVWFQRYERRLFPTTPVVDELANPDGTAPGLLRQRASLSASWTGRELGFGADGYYFGARTLPVAERPGQGSSQIKSYWQADAFVQWDLSKHLPWRGDRTRTTLQLRVNNLTGFAFPKYVNDPSGAGVQAYGDWRGRTYSLSVATSF
jgi:outer membrane receptor protein involved in Fe transport